MRKISFYLLGFLLAIILSGCSGKIDASKELNMAISGSPLSADPVMLYDGNTGIMCKFFCSTLYEYNNKKELKPALAESYEVSEDGLTYTFHIKEGLKWSDGRPLTAEDFVFGFRRFSDPNVGSNAVYLITDCCKLKNAEKILAGELPLSELGVSAPDNLTFIVELEEPCTYFTDLLTNNNFTPCNEDFYHSKGNKYGSSHDAVLSCGPYILDRYEPLATQIHFVKNPYYYDSDSILLSGVNIQVIANQQQALMCYETGAIDIMEVKGELLELTDDDPELNILPGASLYFLFLNQNGSRPELMNKNIRMAISKSIDRQDITDNLLRSGFSPMTRIIPPGFYFETDGTDYAIDQHLYDEYAIYDPDTALTYWKQGLSELGVSSMTFELIFNSDKITECEAIAAQLERNLPGLHIELLGVPFKERSARRAKGEYEIMLSNWFPDYSDPTSFYALYLSNATAKSYHNPEYDEAYDKTCTTEMSKNAYERNKLLHKVEDIIMEDAGTVPIYTTGNTYLIRSNVSGFQTPPTGTGIIITGLSKEEG
ncbi:MAG: peptide ABC transporter substrate-binding protein [Lachnospiraceae bacterium]|nr:peptide ABC transporter substrate-binding protein [Lachnospiraceae bacterium]